MSDDGVNSSSGAFEDVDKGAGVEVGLFEEEVELATVGFAVGEVVAQELRFKALGDVIFELDFGVEAVGGRPCLGEG